jgi:cytochrome c oxidase cbb3-type subunit 3
VNRSLAQPNRHWLGVSICLLGALGALSCDRAPSDLREWTRADHDHTQNPGAAQVEVKPDAGSPLAVYGIDEVTVVAWERSCATCHGSSGAGDGPQGALTKARNLTDAVWQAAATDEGIADAIRNGRGMMPASKLPEPTIQSLVRLVRLLDPRRKAAHGAASAPAPQGSANSLPAPHASAVP